jgi:uncharacterized protein YkwD
MRVSRILLPCLAAWLYFMPLDTIASAEDARPPKDVLKEKLAALPPDNAEAAYKLAEWCKDYGLIEDRVKLLEKAIAVKPDYEEARTALGFKRGKDGNWFRDENTPPQEGMVKFKGEWVTEERAKLLRLAEQARSSDEAKALKAIPQIVTWGEDGVAELSRLADDLTAEMTGLLAPDKADSVTESVRRQILARRQRIYKLAMDERSYNKGRSFEKTVREVDTLVGEFVQLCDAPAAAFTKLDRKAAAKMKVVEAACTEIEKCTGTSTGHAQKVQDALTALAAVVTNDKVFSNEAMRPFRQYNESVDEDNAALKDKLSKEEWDTVELINAYRDMIGLKRLRLNARLIDASKKHSKEMDELKYFSHDSPKPDHATMTRRIELEGFKSSIIGENIAEGNSAAVVFSAWRASPGHHRNMLKGDYLNLGIGESGGKWTTNFGGRESK